MGQRDQEDPSAGDESGRRGRDRHHHGHHHDRRPGHHHHGNRYGRSEDAREAILRAADGLLAEVDFSGVTIEGIAKAAGVAKQTIYRWWRSKTEVLMDALLDDVAELPEPRDHGNLADDLRYHLGQLAAFLTGTHEGLVCKALIGYAQHDRGFAAALRARYVEQQRARDRLVLDRAVARGELPAGLDAGAADPLVGPLYYRALITGEAIDEAFLEELIAQFTARYARPSEGC